MGLWMVLACGVASLLALFIYELITGARNQRRHWEAVARAIGGGLGDEAYGVFPRVSVTHGGFEVEFQRGMMSMRATVKGPLLGTLSPFRLVTKRSSPSSTPQTELPKSKADRRLKPSAGARSLAAELLDQPAVHAAADALLCTRTVADCSYDHRGDLVLRMRWWRTETPETTASTLQALTAFARAISDGPRLLHQRSESGATSTGVPSGAVSSSTGSSVAVPRAFGARKPTTLRVNAPEREERGRAEGPWVKVVWTPVLLDEASVGP